MHDAPDQASEATTKDFELSDFWRALLYRWFVQYNPAYLMSAAFVFAGCFFWSKGVVHTADLTSTLGIPLLAEIYALALIGGAALLTRIGQRRPAVFLSLIFIVYQWDTTLHTEACAYLGSVGVWASISWMVVFVAKIFMITWALRIRIHRRMLAASVLAALGMVVAPHALPNLTSHEGGNLLAGWIFGLISLYDGAAISSQVPLDDWGQTVLRRVTRAAWLISGALVGIHVVMWSDNYPLSFLPTILGLPLLAIPRLRTEVNVWIVIVATSTITFVVAPSSFFVIDILVSGALCLRLLAPRMAALATQGSSPAGAVAPYRINDTIRNQLGNQAVSLTTPTLTASERMRCWSGALFSLYLGIWAMRWGHEAHHVLALDVALTFVAAIAAWRTRAPATFGLPLSATYIHLIVQSRLIPIPSSEASLGKVAVAFGFALLGGSLALSYRYRNSDVPSKTS
jgi:hypothetical protein